ncbi:taurine dioxygenase, partial [Variovorax humicola]
MNTTVQTNTVPGSPAIVSAAARKTSIKIEQLTASIGAELVGVNLADAAVDEGLFKEVYAALLK